MDFLGPIGGCSYFVVVDAMSKWIEVFKANSTNSAAVIDKLSELFSKWGLPKQIVSDNGPQFASKQFEEFTQANGIEHIFTAPYHPASNGLAENAVRTLKRVIKKALSEKNNVERALWSFLAYYRNIEHSTTGESPAMLLLGRRIRTRLDIIKPDRERQVIKSQQRQLASAPGENRAVGKGEEVWYRQYLKGEKWVAGRVIDELGSCDYKVVGKDGETVHRHIDQIRKRPSGRPRLSLISGPGNLGEKSDTSSQTIDGGVCGNDLTVRSEGSTEQAQLDDRNDKDLSIEEETSTSHSPGTTSASPTVSPPNTRPIRQCRLNKPPIYKF